MDLLQNSGSLGYDFPTGAYLKFHSIFLPHIPLISLDMQGYVVQVAKLLALYLDLLPNSVLLWAQLTKWIRVIFSGVKYPSSRMQRSLLSIVFLSHWWQKPSNSMVHIVTTSYKSLKAWDLFLASAFCSTGVQSQVIIDKNLTLSLLHHSRGYQYSTYQQWWSSVIWSMSDPALISHFRVCFLGLFPVPNFSRSVSLETDSETEICMLKIFEKCCKKKGKQALGWRRSWTERQLQERTQQIPWDVMELGWPFRVVQLWGKKSQTFVFLHQPVVGYGLPPERDLTLGEGTIQMIETQLWAMNTQYSEQLWKFF